MKGLVFDIKRYSVNDGPGIRTTVFFKGCPLKCIWCHNPESQDKRIETMAMKRTLDGKVHIQDEEVGYYIEADEVQSEVMKDIVFYEESGGGVTLSGGEPTMQEHFLYELVKGLKEKGIHVTMDTCGHAPWKTFESLLDFIDLYLYDLKLLNSEEHKHYTGVENIRILENLRRLSEAKAKIEISLPVIPGINDSKVQMESMADYLSKLPNSPIAVRLLGFHTIGRDKYIRLKKSNPMTGKNALHPEALIPYKLILESKGFHVKLNA